MLFTCHGDDSAGRAAKEVKENLQLLQQISWPAAGTEQTYLLRPHYSFVWEAAEAHMQTGGL